MRRASKRVLVIAMALGFAHTVLLGAAESFAVLTDNVEISERGRVTSYFVVCQESRYFFLPPPGWKVQGNVADREVVLVSPDRTASARMRFAAPKLTFGSDPADSRTEIAKRYANGKITAELLCYTADSKGPAFEIEHLGGHQRKMLTRLVFIRDASNSIEFEFTTTADKFTDCRFTFANLLTTFRSEINGATRAETPPPVGQ